MVCMGYPSNNTRKIMKTKEAKLFSTLLEESSSDEEDSFPFKQWKYELLLVYYFSNQYLKTYW